MYNPVRQNHPQMIKDILKKCQFLHTENTKQMINILKNTKDMNIDIIDTHHNQKQESPSDTALMTANNIQKSVPNLDVINTNEIKNAKKSDSSTLHKRSGKP